MHVIVQADGYDILNDMGNVRIPPRQFVKLCVRESDVESLFLTITQHAVRNFGCQLSRRGYECYAVGVNDDEIEGSAARPLLNEDRPRSGLSGGEQQAGKPRG